MCKQNPENFDDLLSPGGQGRGQLHSGFVPEARQLGERDLATDLRHGLTRGAHPEQWLRACWILGLGGRGLSVWRF